MALHRRGRLNAERGGSRTLGILLALVVLAIVGLLFLAGYLVSLRPDDHGIRFQPTNPPPVVPVPRS